MPLSMKSEDVRTFGDVRRLLVETLVNLQNREIDVSRAMAIAATVKVLNENVQVEINAAKLALATEGRAHTFGRVVGMGRRLIASEDVENEGGSL